MFRRIHAAGYGNVAGGNATGKQLGMRERIGDILVAEESVAEIIIVGDGAFAAHLVVGGALVFLNFRSAGVPIGFAGTHVICCDYGVEIGIIGR